MKEKLGKLTKILTEIRGVQENVHPEGWAWTHLDEACRSIVKAKDFIVDEESQKEEY